MKKFKLKPIELWESLDEMWLHNWEQLNLTGNFKWLYVNEKDWSRKLQYEIGEKKYFELHDQHAELSGDSSMMERIMTLMQQRIEARALVGAGDKSQINWVNMYTEQLKVLTAGGEDVDIIKTRLLVQKAYGMPIKPKETTVTEYIKIMQIVQELNNDNTNNNSEDGED